MENLFVDAGQRIAELRGEMTQAEFAQRLGVDRKTIGRWEAGERLPDGQSLLALTREFHADVNYILTGRRATVAVPAALKPTLSADEVAVVESYRKASKDGRDLISMAAKAADRELAGKKKRAA